MMMRKATRMAAALALILIALPASAQPAKPPPAGDAARGKQIFNADGCYECHGYAGQGSRSSGPRLARIELDFDAFKTELRQPSNEMPPYAKSVVSDRDAADIYAFLRSLPAPPAASSIPMLSR